MGYTPRGTSGRNTKERHLAECVVFALPVQAFSVILGFRSRSMWLGIILYIGHILVRGRLPSLRSVL